jgi:magnesium transporter
MINIMGVTRDLKLAQNLSLEDLTKDDLLWYWVDFDAPSGEEKMLLETTFEFHHLAIEDCIYSFNSPKLDYYDGYNFFIINSIDLETLKPKEISMFISENYIVSYHGECSEAIYEAWKRVKENTYNWEKGPTYAAHQIIDKVVDQFFPVAYKIEERLNKIEVNDDDKTIHKLIDEIFDIRKELLKLRKTVNAMRDLLYRILNSERLNGFEEHYMYFSDIHDHLVKLSDMVESSREITADMRDSYLSLNSAHMNNNMMVLTVMTAVFIPLTFIVGVYGMNFSNMPELDTKYGYFVVLGVMVSIGISMLIWFKRKGWLDV